VAFKRSVPKHQSKKNVYENKRHLFRSVGEMSMHDIVYVSTCYKSSPITALVHCSQRAMQGTSLFLSLLRRKTASISSRLKQ
jgi:hypothetical protein